MKWFESDSGDGVCLDVVMFIAPYICNEPAGSHLPIDKYFICIFHLIYAFSIENNSDSHMNKQIV